MSVWRWRRRHGVPRVKLCMASLAVGLIALSLVASVVRLARMEESPAQPHFLGYDLQSLRGSKGEAGMSMQATAELELVSREATHATWLTQSSA
jgi:hypothetical protein